MGDDLASRVRQVIGQPISGQGADLEDVVIAGSRKRPVIRIIVDADDGLSLDKAADINRACAKAIDEVNVMGEQSYVVEVTSPGVSRPLTAARHWRRNLGRLVRIQPREDGEVFTGRIVAASDTTATVDVAGSPREFPYRDVKKAVIQVELKRGEG